MIRVDVVHVNVVYRTPVVKIVVRLTGGTSLVGDVRDAMLQDNRVLEVSCDMTYTFSSADPIRITELRHSNDTDKWPSLVEFVCDSADIQGLKL